ncbi:MAG: class I SAM-dependent methyltransferase [Tannerellaceae bacterium]|jgi:SAM-dependent methyltransferase|nr:class I SAM-dependent methyltransferase [Tannerellaceae bacterium]
MNGTHMHKPARKEKLGRLSNFQMPSILNRGYIIYLYHFADLKKAFDLYIKDGNDVLDIGCGNKPYEEYIQGLINPKEQTARYTGCDIVQSSAQKVDIICEATNIPEPSGTYDIVLCTQVIEHVFEHQKVFSEAYRLLKPGGYFIVSGPMVWSLHEEPYDFYRFTKYGFCELLTGSGFSIVHEKMGGGQWATFGQMFLHITSISAKNKFLRKILHVFCKPTVLFSNLFFPWIDKKFNNANYTLNYLFVGKK